MLPRGYGYDFDSLTREENATGSNSIIIFGICILLIYLILCALYESFFVPFAVILAVPCGLMGAFLLAKAMGMENNIYLQTGIIMQIGLLSKTAILITEYAGDRRRAGMSLAQAAVSAAKVRLRPILMTVLTCVFGMLPLMFSTGCGRQRKLDPRYGRRRRYDRRNAGPAVPCTGPVHRLPDAAGEVQTDRIRHRSAVGRTR